MVRKGSLQLSINAIVILIMAIAMLGVGIYFINTVLKGTLEDTIIVGEDVKVAIQQELQRTGNKLFISGLSDNRLSMSQNSKDQIVIGINNKEETTLNYYINFEPVKAAGSDGEELDDPATFDIRTLGNVYDPSNVPGPEAVLEIPIGEYSFEPLIFEASSSRGDILYRVTVKTADKDSSTNPNNYETYATQSFFVTVQ